MLGIIVSGRLVQTDFQQIGENQFLITVPDADNINHIVVFLTGTIPFPDGTGGAVYFSWPDPTAPPNWQFLGYISNAKPSAIFKISTLKKNHEFENSNLGIFGVGKISHVAQIGISVEPLNVIEQQAATVAETATNSFMEFKISYHCLLYKAGMRLLKEDYSKIQIFGRRDEDSVGIKIFQHP
ncbi:hypothetical protein KPH14_010082 [Odynerus spinipes]|uniref:Hikeshi-like N-terminal domain-containing protein n=1 Tax=Odynerus spinipes TaxID=1348599 RepID=A0AAD9RUC8_9HYME|nr:hypothetical protein KPH14_010082 [Odynerus spinipes]